METITELKFIETSSRIVFTSRDTVIPEKTDLMVFDGNTIKLFPERSPEHSIVLPCGEVAKQWNSIDRIIKRAMSLSLERNSLIVGIGGGVVTDITAFAASLYMRGCRLILIPTTLLAMVDAAIGGKTGVDFGGIKNLIGTFYPAREIRICPDFLKNLPDREYQTSFSEIIKHAMLSPDELMPLLTTKLALLKKRDTETLKELITAAIRVKADIVSRDLKEQGIRAHLNLGHTFAHALEAATNFSLWTHGEAVAWGLIKALELGTKLGITDPLWAKNMYSLIQDYGFGNVNPVITLDELKKAMEHDKKKQKGSLRFVLLKGPGQPVIKEVREKDLNTVLKTGPSILS